MKHILIVTQYFWPESFRINDIALGLRDRGYKVSVLTGLPNYPNGKFFKGFNLFSVGRDTWQGLSIYRIPLFPRFQGKSWQLVLNYLSFALMASLATVTLGRIKFDVVFVFEPSPITVCLPALLLKKLTGVPVVLWVQDLWPESLSATGAIKSKFVLRFVNKVVGYIYHGCDLILIQSRAFVDSIKSFSVIESKILYFPNSAEDIYQPVHLGNNPPEAENIPQGFKIMFAGNIGAAQDFETILLTAEKLRKYSDIHWVILGDGRKFEWLKEQVKAKGLSKSFHLLGRHPMESMPRYFSLADVLLVSLKNEEIFSLTIPSKVQSYLACGRPILASLCGEGGRIIEEAGAGLVVGAEQPEEFANAVLELYHMSVPQREHLGLLGVRCFKEQFEKEMLLDNLTGWLDELIGDT